MKDLVATDAFRKPTPYLCPPPPPASAGDFAGRMCRAQRDRQHLMPPEGRRQAVNARLGKAEGIVATAHKLPRILHAIIT